MMSALRPLRVAEFDDDVVDPGRETRVAYQTDAEPVTGFVAMRPFSERDHVVFGKRTEDAVDRIVRCRRWRRRRRRRDVRRRDRHGRASDEHDQAGGEDGCGCGHRQLRSLISPGQGRARAPVMTQPATGDR